MYIDLANGWHRKDSSSASNIYYGYSKNPNSTDSDFTYAIRKVNTTSGVESSRWTDDNMGFISSWSGRTYSFSEPLTGLSLTWSTVSSPINAVYLNWSAINGVNYYTITITDENNNLIGLDGSQFKSAYTKENTSLLVNEYSYSQRIVNDGTYSVTVKGSNIAGYTSSTITINF